jgi:hypothetical protein
MLHQWMSGTRGGGGGAQKKKALNKIGHKCENNNFK